MYSFHAGWNIIISEEWACFGNLEEDTEIAFGNCRRPQSEEYNLKI